MVPKIFTHHDHYFIPLTLKWDPVCITNQIREGPIKEFDRVIEALPNFPHKTSHFKKNFPFFGLIFFNSILLVLGKGGVVGVGL